MSCKYAKTNSFIFHSIGNSDINSETFCQIKWDSQKKRIEIDQKLFDLVFLKGTIGTEYCPMVDDGNWNDCPYSKI